MTSKKKTDLIGPSPLSAHVMTAANIWVGALPAFHQAMAGEFKWHPSLAKKAEALREKILSENRPAVETAIQEEAEARIKKFLEGVTAYQQFQRSSDHHLPPVLFSNGAVSIHDFDPDGDKNRPVVLAVPSLVNPAHILDLRPQNSLLRYLRDEGLHPLLLNWGRPEEEQRFDLNDYIEKRLLPLIAQCSTYFGKPITLLGYCMGGTLAVAAAQLAPDHVDRLALLATPWDFHADGDGPKTIMQQCAKQFEPMMQAEGVLKAEALQLLFASLDPTLVERKFRDFSDMGQDSARARAFVALEDWANSGPPLSADVARDVFQHWYQDNQSAQGQWRIQGHYIRPEHMKTPAIAFIPQNDRIVPPLSALHLAEALKAEIHQPQAGHVGMVVGRRAKDQCWAPLKDWLLKS